jgi:hypothetical protein
MELKFFKEFSDEILKIIAVCTIMGSYNQNYFLNTKSYQCVIIV